jgi:hypothetical protein
MLITFIMLLVGTAVAFKMFGNPPSDVQPRSVAASKISPTKRLEAPEKRPKSELHRTVGSDHVIPSHDVLQSVPVSGTLPREVRASGNRLSLDVIDKPLKKIIDEVHQQSGIAIVLSDEIPNARVSMQFDDFPIDQGLQRLLDKYDSFFLFSSIDGGTARLTTVWVYPKERGQGLAPIPSPLEVDTDDLQQQAVDPDMLKRALATAALIERSGNEGVEILNTALTDPEEQMRIQALNAALRVSVDLSPGLLQELAQHDPSPTVRAIALVGLTDGDRNDATTDSDLWEVVEIARQDSAPEVSELATQLLEIRRSNLQERSEEPDEQGESQGQLPEGEPTE